MLLILLFFWGGGSGEGVRCKNKGGKIPQRAGQKEGLVLLPV